MYFQCMCVWNDFIHYVFNALLWHAWVTDSSLFLSVSISPQWLQVIMRMWMMTISSQAAFTGEAVEELQEGHLPGPTVHVLSSCVSLSHVHLQHSLGEWQMLILKTSQRWIGKSEQCMPWTYVTTHLFFIPWLLSNVVPHHFSLHFVCYLSVIWMK